MENIFGKLILVVFTLFKPLGWFLRKLAKNSPEYQQLQKFHQLKDDLKVAYENDEFDKSIMYADQLIDMSRHYNKNWDYSNAVHWAYVTKGKVALNNGDIEAAKNYLMKSMTIKTSPQLSSYGPDLDLVKSLKYHNCNETINEYITWSKKKWPRGEKILEEIIGQRSP